MATGSLYFQPTGSVEFTYLVQPQYYPLLTYTSATGSVPPKVGQLFPSVESAIFLNRS